MLPEQNLFLVSKQSTIEPGDSKKPQFGHLKKKEVSFMEEFQFEESEDESRSLKQ